MDLVTTAIMTASGGRMVMELEGTIMIMMGMIMTLAIAGARAVARWVAGSTEGVVFMAVVVVFMVAAAAGVMADNVRLRKSYEIEGYWFSLLARSDFRGFIFILGAAGSG